MSPVEVGIFSFVALLALLLLRAPIGLAMLLCGMGGMYMLFGDVQIFIAKFENEAYGLFANESLAIIPIFLLMGQFASLSGISAKLFRAVAGFLGHKKGGVAMAAVGACAAFGAICGSSLATAATMGRVALPEMKKYGYEAGLASATLAAGGTLGILIPPSVILVIYAILTEANIATLFLAAFVPGVMAALGYMLCIYSYVSLHPEASGSMPRIPYTQRCKLLLEVWPLVAVFVLMVGGIYLGWFTPSEGASVGALGTGIIALCSGKMQWKVFIESCKSTAISTAMIYFIILGASFYNGFLALTQIPSELVEYAASLALSPWLILGGTLLGYILLGCFMDSLSMILLTIPIIFPMILELDFGMSAEATSIWFGILVLIVVEMGLITPPVGMNLLIIKSIQPATPTASLYRAVSYFIGFDILRVILLLAFPSISVFLIS